MHLTDLQLLPETADADLAAALTATWQHVEDIARALLPEQWSVGGVGKLVAVLPIDAPDGPDYACHGGSARLRLPTFDAAAFLARELDDQDETALQLLAEALRRLCRHHAVDPAPVEALVARVLGTHFRHQWSMSRLGRWDLAHRVHATVQVLHQRGGTDVTVRLARRGGGSRDHLLLVAEPWSTVWFRCFESRWDGDEFVLLDRSGEETARWTAPA